AGWARRFPREPRKRDAGWPSDPPDPPEEFEQRDDCDIIRYRPPRADSIAELSILVRSGREEAALIRLLGANVRAPDPDLEQGLRRVASLLADFLERWNMLKALERSEEFHRQASD